MDWGNIAGWLTGGTRDRELNDMRAQWAETERLWGGSPFASKDLEDISFEITKRLIKDRRPAPAVPILERVDKMIWELLRKENVGVIEPVWPEIDGDVAIAVEVRKLLARRRRWSGDFERVFEAFERPIAAACQDIFTHLPDSCFRDWDVERGDALGVPLVELLEKPAETIERLVLLPYDDAALELELFHRIRSQIITNVLVASGFPPDTDPHTVSARLVLPTRHKPKSPAELAEIYLRFTPFLELLELPVPFEVTMESRFEHCHIIGGTGHGKTQLMQRMIHDDLVAAQKDGRSVVVIDSQGDLINKLMRLELFSSDVEDSLADRFVLIDPSDIEFPAALNLFDAHLDRTESYSAVDREKVLNGVVELYETFFGAMLGAELTQKQGVIFRYLARLMVAIPGATIHTLMQIMEDGAPWKSYMGQLEGSARHFFATEFFHPSFAATKKQILRRLWGVLSTPAFERMFVQPENKLDLYQAMNDGKIILVSTAKDLLKADGSALLGRFFIAMIAQAALERSVIPAEKRTPTFVYVDEAHEYFDDNVEAILNQARKYRVGLTVAHHHLDQLSPRLRAAFHTNTALKCAASVSARDARAMAEELHTTADFVESMRRRPDRTEFAAWLKGMTPTAVRLSTPLGYLERQPTLAENQLDELSQTNRERYCGTLININERQSAVPQNQGRPEPMAAALEGTSAPSAPLGPRIEASAPRSQGKGGRTHQYLQALIKGLGEQAGFKATIEAPVSEGQVDVLLERDGSRAAFEISISTTVGHEQANIQKCLDAGIKCVALVVESRTGQRARFIEAVLGAFAPLDARSVVCLLPEELPDYIAGLGAPPTETVVRGYSVKVARSVGSIDEARARRETIARVVARSTKKIPG